MRLNAYHSYRQALSLGMTAALKTYSLVSPASRSKLVKAPRAIPEKRKRHPEDFNPLSHECFQNPYEFYRVLRDDYPVYRLANGVVCISRYQDIVDLSRNTTVFASQHQGLVANLQPHQDLLKEVARFEGLGSAGVIPADVLATSDPPRHTAERKVGHACLNSRFVQQQEAEVRELCRGMLAPWLVKGDMEFMQAIGWRLPMVLILRLMGLPEQDFAQIKTWCVQILDSQNGVQSGKELALSRAAALSFLRYCWRHYLAAKKRPGENLLGIFARAAMDPAMDFDDQRAASAVFQLLIAGSDSSATTMGNAIRLLIEHPDIQQTLRDNPDQIPAFIEEVFRLESAFQGHFRWVTTPTRLHGVHLPKGTRIFLMWASGNRDERFWDQPDQLLLNRRNGKKHLTFGHGIHACLGRELARMEIRILLQAFLQNTTDLRIAGETPYIASMFSRTLVQLPLQFKKVSH